MLLYVAVLLDADSTNLLLLFPAAANSYTQSSITNSLKLLLFGLINDIGCPVTVIIWHPIYAQYPKAVLPFCATR